MLTAWNNCLVRIMSLVSMKKKTKQHCISQKACVCHLCMLTLLLILENLLHFWIYFCASNHRIYWTVFPFCEFKQNRCWLLELKKICLWIDFIILFPLPDFLSYIVFWRCLCFELYSSLDKFKSILKLPNSIQT